MNLAKRDRDTPYLYVCMYTNAIFSTPSYASLTSQNTVTIPACFVLRLNKPMPMCVALVRQIQQITELECAELSTTQPLLSLITSDTSEGKLETGVAKGLFVVRI